MPDWDAWGDPFNTDFDRDDTRKQVICDDCGKINRRGLRYRDDFETPRRLCKACCDKHDNHLEVIAERDHLEAVEADHDDF